MEKNDVNHVNGRKGSKPFVRLSNSIKYLIFNKRNNECVTTIVHCSVTFQSGPCEGGCVGEPLRRGCIIGRVAGWNIFKLVLEEHHFRDRPGPPTFIADFLSGIRFYDYKKRQKLPIQLLF